MLTMLRGLLSARKPTVLEHSCSTYPESKPESSYQHTSSTKRKHHSSLYPLQNPLEHNTVKRARYSDTSASPYYSPTPGPNTAAKTKSQHTHIKHKYQYSTTPEPQDAIEGPERSDTREISDLENDPSTLILNSVETDDPPTGSPDLSIEDEVILALIRCRNSLLAHNYATMCAHVGDLINHLRISRPWRTSRIRTTLIKHLAGLLDVKERSLADLDIKSPADIMDFWPELVSCCGLDGTHPRKPYHELEVHLPARLRCPKMGKKRPSTSTPRASRRGPGSASTPGSHTATMINMTSSDSNHASYIALVEAAVRQQLRDFSSSSRRAAPRPLLPPDFLALHALTRALVPAGLPSWCRTHRVCDFVSPVAPSAAVLREHDVAPSLRRLRELLGAALCGWEVAAGWKTGWGRSCAAWAVYCRDGDGEEWSWRYVFVFWGEGGGVKVLESVVEALGWLEGWRVPGVEVHSGKYPK